MSWTHSENDCYPSGIETPYWIIGVGFITSLLINSFILFSGQSLTTQIWKNIKSCLYNCCCCLYCCSSNNTKINPSPSSEQKQSNKTIKFPSIIKLSINKNIHPQHKDDGDEYEYDEDEYDEEESMIAHRNTTIDISIQEILLNDDDNNKLTPIIAKYDSSLTGSEISGYYKLLKRDDKHPIYQSNHQTLSGDFLLLHYMGINHDKHGQIGWAISYSSFYGFRNELVQIIVNAQHEKDKALSLNINNNYIEIDDNNNDEIKYNHLKFKGNNNDCIWKLCQLDNYHNTNCINSHIMCYDDNDQILRINLNENNDGLIKQSTKIQLNGFSEITNDFMKTIDMNGNYILNDVDIGPYISSEKEEKIDNNLSIDSNIFPKIEMKYNSNECRSTRSVSSSNHSLPSLFSSNSFQKMRHYQLKKTKQILEFQHETNKNLRFFLPNKRIKFKKYHPMYHHVQHHRKDKPPKAAIFDDGLKQFIAYIPSSFNEENQDEDEYTNILDGANWRIISWDWKIINNLTISTWSASMSYYFAQLLSIWIFIIGSYQWYIDIKSFIKYYNNYNNIYSLWKQYECYCFIVTNTPNMKQLILIICLIIWSLRVNTKSNYQIYLQKQTILQKILIIGYFILILFFIPILFTHFIPLYIPFAILFCITGRIARNTKCDSKKQRNDIHTRPEIMRKFAKEMNDVTITNPESSSYGFDFHFFFASVIWKCACIYFVIILCVPVMSRIYNGISIGNAFKQTYNQRKTEIYFENVEKDYQIDLDRLRLLLYWLL